MKTKNKNEKEKSQGKNAPEIRKEKDTMDSPRDVNKSSNTKKTINRSSKRPGKPFLIL